MKETVLLIPEYGQELRSSLQQIAQSLMRAAAERDDLKLVVPFPASGSRWKNWTPEKWQVDAPNVEFVPVVMDKYSECPLGRVSADWANGKFGGRTDYYVVATFRPTAAVGIRRLFSKLMVGFRPEVLNIYGIGDCDAFRAMSPDLPNEMLFHCLDSWNIIMGTESFGNHMFRQFSRLFVPSVCQEIRKKTTVEVIGVDTERLDKVVPMFPDNDKLRLVYGGRYTNEKCGKDYIPVATAAFERGLPIELGMFLVDNRMTINGGSIDELQRLPFVKIWRNAEPVDDNFWSYGKCSQLFLFTEKLANYGLMPMELLYLGVPGVFVDEPNVKGMIPEDYPYVYRTKADAMQAAQVLLSKLHRGEPVYDMEKMRRFIREKHNRKYFEKRVFDIAVALSSAKRNGVKVSSMKEILSRIEA